MRNDNKKIGSLYGIGIGPGEPKLLTVKAKEILESVDTIFVPKAREEGLSYARNIIESVIPRQRNFVEITFPMTKDKDILRSHWQKAAGKIANSIKKNKSAAFVTIGDPFIYSTYIYLLRTMRRDFPDIDVETIPGISAFNAAASAAGISLVEANERLAVIPVTKNLKGVKEALRDFDTVALMKVGSKLKNIIRLLKDMKLIKNSVLVSRVGHADEMIIRDIASIKDDKCGYLSVIIVKKGNT